MLSCLSRRLSVAARKFRRKVSAVIADAPIIRGARHEVVHVDAPVSNVTLHLTQVQWQHSQMDAGNGTHISLFHSVIRMCNRLLKPLKLLYSDLRGSMVRFRQYPRVNGLGG
jgi:hypothetical protein